MTIVSISLPNWITYSVTTPSNTHLTQRIGLTRSCSNFRDPPCRPYPSEFQCEGDEAAFCRMWRSAGFLANFAAALHLVMIVVYIVLINGGKQRREGGWRALAGLLLSISAVEYAIIGVIVSSLLLRLLPSQCHSSLRRPVKGKVGLADNSAHSPTSTTTTTSSPSPAGPLTPLGSSALSAPRSPPPVQSPLSPPITFCPPRAATTTCLIPTM